MVKILIADDDPKLCKMVKRTLLYEGFQVFTAANGREALDKATSQKPELIILDWMMPEIDGIEVAMALRQANDLTPILMLTAKDAVEDRVTGLDSGADDYLVKPFAPTELLARIRALLRRTGKNASTEKTLSYADLELDPVSRETRRNGRLFTLTPKEFDLLQYLLRHPRQVLVRDRILEEVWGYDFGGEDNVLEVYIGYLRKKTEANSEPRLIHTVRGVGYVLREE
jgi:two-component system response regulator MprA